MTNFLVEVLRILKAAASFPDGVYISSMADPGLFRSIHRIAANAYPGYRPAPVGMEGSPASFVEEQLVKTRARLKPAGVAAGTASQTGVLPLEGFGQPKPNSPEARIITELARDVAYLVGSGRPVRAPVPSPRRRKKQSIEQEPSPPTQVIAQAGAREKPPENAGKLETAGFIPEHGLPRSYHASGLGSGSNEGLDTHDAKTGVANVVTPNPTEGRGRGTESIVSGRPGTYLGCGVTSCGGLGVSGEHGSAAGNVPHAAFVLRDTNRHEVGLKTDQHDDEQDKEPSVDSVGTIAANNSGTEALESGDARRETDEKSSGLGSLNTLVTPLAMLSAREASFRAEVIERKKHYGLGGTTKGNTADDMDRQTLPKTVLGLHQGGQKTPPPAGGERGGSLQRSRCPRPRGLWTSSAPIDVAQSPVLANTRPAGVKPHLDPHRVLNADSTDPAPNANPTPTSPGGENQHDGQKHSTNVNEDIAGKEFVTFARPAAHWSITNAVGGNPDRARSKGVRVPGGPKGGAVGRFACRGYLLDPTFDDHNPVILHPRLPLIGGGDSGGGGLNQVPADSTLAGLITSQVAKGATKKGAGVEPYRNIVEVLSHSVGVSGERKAGKQRFFDEQGRPLSPVNFHHVYDSVEKRKHEHAEPDLIPFP